MKFMLAKSLSLATLVTLCSTETLDLGDLKQYHADSKISPPKLEGRSLWISGQDGDGYNIAISSETQSQVQGALSGCEKTEDNCYGKVKEVVRSANFEFDNELRARTELVSRFIGVLGAAFVALIASILAVQHRLDHALDATVVHVPQVKLSEATKLEAPTKVVVSAQGSAVITITPTPDATKVQGSQTPSITPVTAAQDGFAKGDLDIVLDQGLAARIDEIMHRMMGPCEDGTKFDKENGSKNKRAGTSYGAAICAAEAAAAMAHRGGALNDLLYLGPGHLAFGFKDAAGAAARAAHVVNTFIQGFAPQLNIDPELAEQIANLLFALAMETIMDKKAIGKDNRVDGSLITTSSRAAATATTTGCPDPTKTPLLCGHAEEKNDCDLRMPKLPSTKAVCESGKYKDCECVAPVEIIDYEVSSTELQAIFLLMDSPDSTEGPVCDIHDLSKIPSNVFSSDKNNVYHHFCERWSKEKSFKMTVDAAGNNKDVESHMKAAIQKRTPPPDPDTWKDYDIFLNYTMSDAKKDCSMTCLEVYSTLGQACRNNGDMNVAMAREGILDAGCGVFSYSIAKAPPPKPKPDVVPYDFSQLTCHGRDEFGEHDDLHEDWVAAFGATACIRFAGHNQNAHGSAIADPSTSFRVRGEMPGVSVEASMRWKSGCVQGERPKDLVIVPARLIKDIGGCYDNLFSTWKKCINGGVGGTLQAGCLVYSFGLRR